MSTFKHIYNEKLKMIAERKSAEIERVLRGEEYNKALKPHFDNVLKYAKEGLPDDENQILDMIYHTTKGMQEQAKKKFPKGHVMGYGEMERVIHNAVDYIFRYIDRNKKGVSRKLHKIVRKIEDELAKITSVQITGWYTPYKP